MYIYNHVLIVIIILQINMIQVESTLSSIAAKVRRTQSVTSLHNVELESRPIASTSSVIQPEIDFNHHYHHQAEKPLIERESKNVRFSGSAGLIDPIAETHGDRLDPRRDGVFARIRNMALHYGSTAIVGSVIGAAGGFAAQQLVFQNNNITQPMNQTDTTHPTQTESDGISNPF